LIYETAGGFSCAILYKTVLTTCSVEPEGRENIFGKLLPRISHYNDSVGNAKQIMSPIKHCRLVQTIAVSKYLLLCTQIVMELLL